MSDKYIDISKINFCQWLQIESKEKISHGIIGRKLVIIKNFGKKYMNGAKIHL